MTNWPITRLTIVGKFAMPLSRREKGKFDLIRLQTGKIMQHLPVAGGHSVSAGIALDQCVPDGRVRGQDLFVFVGLQVFHDDPDQLAIGDA